MGSTRLQSMFMQGGIPASRHPWRYNATQPCTTLLRSEQYGAVGIPLTVSQSKSDLVAHNSGSCGSVCFLCSCCCFSGKDQRPLDQRPLDWWFFCNSNCGYFANQFANPFALNTAFLENGRCVYIPKMSCCQSTGLAKNHFAKISFCQNMDMPKYQSWVLPKYQFATICLQNDRLKSSQNNNLGRPQIPLFSQSPGVMVPLEPSSPVIATTSYPNIS